MSVLWHDGRLVAFDIETTGVDLEEARIVTAAVAVCGGGLETETLSLLADPGVEIPDEAAGVHGITTEAARAEGAPAVEVVSAVLETLRPYCGRAAIVAFNARFDLTILDREARRYGLEPLDGLLVVDPFVIDKHLHRYRRGSRKLDAQAAHYGVVLDEAHEAVADAVAAARVAWCIGKRGEVIRRARDMDEQRELDGLQAEWEAVRDDLSALHAAQVRWAAEQAESLERYFRERGKLESPVEREWPVVPVRAVIG
jgi:DNA polymerase-3 subunit epsilon